MPMHRVRYRLAHIATGRAFGQFGPTIARTTASTAAPVTATGLLAALAGERHIAAALLGAAGLVILAGCVLCVAWRLAVSAAWRSLRSQ